MLSMDELLRQADFVTLHTSLTGGPQGTRGLIGARELTLFKPGARLINCARGGLIEIRRQNDEQFGCFTCGIARE